MRVKLLVLLIIIVLYGFIYNVMGPLHFNGLRVVIDGYYFSMNTVSMTGYGDITPKTPIAKVMVMTQQLVTIMLVTSMLT